MNNKDLYNAIGGLDEQSLDTKSRRKKAFRWSAAVAAVLAVAIGAGIFLIPSLSPPLTVNAVSTAQYPAMAPYPEKSQSNSSLAQAKWSKQHEAWLADVNAQRREPGYADGLAPFFAQSMEVFLADSQGENKLCSPLNIYMALSMLAEITGGDSRQEIFNVLGAESIEALRKQANDVWNAQYRSDNATFMILANSLWINEALAFRRDTLDTLAENYYVSSYAGAPGSKDMDAALRTWLSEQTGGLLQEQASNLSLDPQTVIALASALRYQAKWNVPFQENNTKPQVFHSPQGDVTLDFLHQSLDNTYYWGSQFGAVELPMENDGGSMWLLLPDDGTTPEQLLSDPEVQDFLAQGSRWEQQKRMIVHFGMPKFDVSSQFDLGDGLKALGIQQVFSQASADFTPLMAGKGNPYLSQCNHAVRVVVDEEGVTAASFVEMATCGALPPPDEEIDFLLDRPFLFVIQSPDGLPLFSGIINQPK